MNLQSQTTKAQPKPVNSGVSAFRSGNGTSPVVSEPAAQGGQQFRQVLLPERLPDGTDEFLARFAEACDFSPILQSISDTLARVGGES